MGELQEFQDRADESWIADYPSLGVKMHCLLNTDEDRIRENIRINLERGHEAIWPHKPQDTECLIIAGGPSLKDGFEDIKERQVQGAKVIALANTAHLLIENHIRPNAHVLLDAKPRNAEFILPGIETTYFIASQCDPSVFDRAEETGNKIYIWHGVNNDAEFEIIHEKNEPWIPVQAGATITLRCLRLFNILGYHRFHMYGFDSCYMDDHHHSYEQPDADKHKRFKLDFEGKTYTVSPWMLQQFMEFEKFVRGFGMGLDIVVHGDGLISNLIKHGGHSTVTIED